MFSRNQRRRIDSGVTTLQILPGTPAIIAAVIDFRGELVGRTGDNLRLLRHVDKALIQQEYSTQPAGVTSIGGFGRVRKAQRARPGIGWQRPQRVTTAANR